MLSVLISLLQTFRVSMRSRAALQLEMLALRHQLQVFQRSRRRRIRLTQADRALLDLVIADLDGLAISCRHRPPRDRHRVAPAGLSTVVDLEEPSPRRSTAFTPDVRALCLETFVPGDHNPSFTPAAVPSNNLTTPGNVT